MANEDDSKSRVALVSFGAAAGAVGLSIISPGIKDAVLAWLNASYDLKLSLDAPLWAGILLVCFSVLVLVIAFVGQSRLELSASRVFNRNSARIGSFLAVKHVGFAPVVRDVRQDELPSDVRQSDLRHLSIDVSADLAENPPSLEAALQKQLQMPAQIGTMLGINPSIGLGYCGIVQAPLQSLAGFQMASWTSLRCFEWHRQEGRWVALLPGAGPDLGVNTTSTTISQEVDLAIAIEVSYAISNEEILLSLPRIGTVSRISIASPALDCITHEQQVSAIAQQFRIALDNARALAAGTKVHVLLAAPMSVGFAVGRMISRTLHPAVRVYAYDRNAQPPYAWGIEINGSAGEAKVVRN